MLKLFWRRWQHEVLSKMSKAVLLSASQADNVSIVRITFKEDINVLSLSCGESSCNKRGVVSKQQKTCSKPTRILEA